MHDAGYLVHMAQRMATKKHAGKTVARGVRWAADLYPRLLKASKACGFSPLVNDLVRKALDSEEAA